MGSATQENPIRKIRRRARIFQSVVGVGVLALIWALLFTADSTHGKIVYIVAISIGVLIIVLVGEGANKKIDRLRNPQPPRRPRQPSR